MRIDLIFPDSVMEKPPQNKLMQRTLSADIKSFSSLIRFSAKNLNEVWFVAINRAQWWGSGALAGWTTK